MSSPKWHAGPSGGAEGERFEGWLCFWLLWTRSLAVASSIVTFMHCLCSALAEVLDLHENHDNPFAGAAGANQGGAWGGGEGNSRAAVTEPPTGARSGKVGGQKRF